MEDNLDIYTGTLEYKDIEFSFVFDKTELRLIPPKEKGHDIHTKWFMKELAEGMYTFGDPPNMETPYLVGQCSETQKTPSVTHYHIWSAFSESKATIGRREPG